MRASIVAIAVGLAVFVAAGCGSGTSTSSGGDTGKPVNGGILKTGIPGNPDHLDPALSYTNEGWEILEATNNGASGVTIRVSDVSSNVCGGSPGAGLL